ncbi:MAG: hypothetical protein ACK5XM_02050, partial [Betaproteobacteria bacterium]
IRRRLPLGPVKWRALEQSKRRSITDLELLRSCGNHPESRANTRSARFHSNDNCAFRMKKGQRAALPISSPCAARMVARKAAHSAAH